MAQKTLAGRRGFTFIEIVVVLAVFGILGTVIARIFTQMYTLSNFNQKRLELNSGMLSVLAQVTDAVSKARTSDAAFRIGRFDDHQPFSSMIRFRSNRDGRIYRFFQQGRNLVEESSGDGTSWQRGKVLTEKLDVVYFSKTNLADEPHPYIDVSLTLEQPVVFQHGTERACFHHRQVRVDNP